MSDKMHIYSPAEMAGSVLPITPLTETEHDRCLTQPSLEEAVGKINEIIERINEYGEKIRSIIPNRDIMD